MSGWVRRATTGVTPPASAALPLNVPPAFRVAAVLLTSICEPAVATNVPLTETVAAET